MSARGSTGDTLAKVRESLAQTAAIAVLLSGADPKDVDRTAALRLIGAQAKLAADWLEQLETEVQP